MTGIAMSQIKVSYLELILQMMNNLHNDTMDFRKPYIRNSLRYVYPLFVFLHVIVALVGFGGNTYILKVIFSRDKKLYRDPMYLLIANLAFSDMIKTSLALPITLAHLLIQNWIFGSFLCIFLPMLQYFPVHATILTFMTIGIDRYRHILYPMKPRIPVVLCILGIWVLSICIVLPYAIYVIYIDLESVLGPQFRGVGLCVKNVDRNTKEYLRAVFILVYIMPLAIIAFLFLKASAELEAKAPTLPSEPCNPQLRSIVEDENDDNNLDLSLNSSPFHQNSSMEQTILDKRSLGCGTKYSRGSNVFRESVKNSNLNNVNTKDDGNGKTKKSVTHETEKMAKNYLHPNYTYDRNSLGLNPNLNRFRISGTDSVLSGTSSGFRHNSSSYLMRQSIIKGHMDNISDAGSEDSINVESERLIQRYLVAMVILFAVCWCPLNILVFTMHFVFEGEHNSGNIDITYLTFIWFAFLSTCVNPPLFSRWQMGKDPPTTKKRLKGYFRFSNRFIRRGPYRKEGENSDHKVLEYPNFKENLSVSPNNTIEEKSLKQFIKSKSLNNNYANEMTNKHNITLPQISVPKNKFLQGKEQFSLDSWSTRDEGYNIDAHFKNYLDQTRKDKDKKSSNNVNSKSIKVYKVEAKPLPTLILPLPQSLKNQKDVFRKPNQGFNNKAYLNSFSQEHPNVDN